MECTHVGLSIGINGLCRNISAVIHWQIKSMSLLEDKIFESVKLWMSDKNGSDD